MQNLKHDQSIQLGFLPFPGTKEVALLRPLVPQLPLPCRGQCAAARRARYPAARRCEKCAPAPCAEALGGVRRLWGWQVVLTYRGDRNEMEWIGVIINFKYSFCYQFLCPMVESLHVDDQDNYKGLVDRSMPSQSLNISENIMGIARDSLVQHLPEARMIFL